MLKSARYSDRIMIVDDNAANLKLMDRMLKLEGYQDIELIGDSREVLEKYKSRRPELILLDLNMPHLNGFDIITALKELEDPLLPPIVIITAQDGKESLHQALSLGARDYISKPFDQDELLIRVRNLLEAQLAHHLLYDQKTVLEQMVSARTKKLEETRLQLVRRLGMAAEYRDEETGNHILRMSHSCALIAEKLGWSKADCYLILNASPMHDIGKIGIPDVILLKPGKFEPDEWAMMKTHAQIGAKLLDGDESDLLQMAKDIAIAHHEKWDGSGYPNGLAGEEIPQSARIAAIADVYDALLSERPYKKPWRVEDALNLIRENKGKHFDPVVVEAFFDVLPEIDKIRAKYSD